MSKATRGSVPVRPSSFELRLSFPVSSRLELWRAFPFSHGAGDGNVGELAAVDGAAEQQSAPAHVAASDEIGRETESLTEMFEKHVDVFGGGDAAEENDLGIRWQRFREPFHVALERGPITRVGLVDIDRGEFLEISENDWRRGRNQSARRRDNENG